MNILSEARAPYIFLVCCCSVAKCYHPTISSSVAPFSSCPQSFPASGSFPMSWLFASGGQSIFGLKSCNLDGIPFPQGVGLLYYQKRIWLSKTMPGSFSLSRNKGKDALGNTKRNVLICKTLDPEFRFYFLLSLPNPNFLLLPATPLAFSTMQAVRIKMPRE